MDFSLLHNNSRFINGGGVVNGANNGATVSSMPSLLEDYDGNNEYNKTMVDGVVEAAATTNGVVDEYNVLKTLLRSSSSSIHQHQSQQLSQQQPPQSMPQMTKKSTTMTRKRKTAAMKKQSSSCDENNGTIDNNAKKRNNGPRTPIVTNVTAAAIVPTATPQQACGGPTTFNERSFHAFVETLIFYNLLSTEMQQTHAESMRALMTIDEANLCSGQNLTRRNNHDLFHLLCQGINVNPECVKRQVSRIFGTFFNSAPPTDLSDKAVLRYVHLWYCYATRETCSLHFLTASNLVALFASSTAENDGDRRRIDDRLGRMCRSCVEHFLRFNNIGKLCPKLYNQSSQAAAVASTTSSFSSSSLPTNVAVHREQQRRFNEEKEKEDQQQTAAKNSKRGTKAAATITSVAAAKTIGLGAARKKMPQSAVAHMSDYSMTTSDDDEEEDYQDDEEEEEFDYDATQTTTAANSAAMMNITSTGGKKN